MTVWLIILGGWFGLYAIGWIIQQIKNEIERERSKQRDEIAVTVFDEQNITDDDFQLLDEALNYVKDSIPKKLTYTRPVELIMPSAMRSRQGQLCPECQAGILVPRRGPYGQFLGCSRYPACKGKKPINWVDKQAKESYKKAFEEQFLRDLEKAYN